MYRDPELHGVVLVGTPSCLVAIGPPPTVYITLPRPGRTRRPQSGTSSSVLPITVTSGDGAARTALPRSVLHLHLRLARLARRFASVQFSRGVVAMPVSRLPGGRENNLNVVAPRLPLPCRPGRRHSIYLRVAEPLLLLGRTALNGAVLLRVLKRPVPCRVWSSCRSGPAPFPGSPRSVGERVLVAVQPRYAFATCACARSLSSSRAEQTPMGGGAGWC